jgi:hypothetical protein
MNWRIELELDTARKIFESSGNPHYAWKAIDYCIKNEILVLPPWLTMYLAQCAERVLSDKAAKTSDLRKVLPWALGFPERRGPGKYLNPYLDPKQLRFALDFAKRVLDGEDPVTARRDACNAVFDHKAAEADDKTLTRWLVRNFDLKKAPKNAEQWGEAAEKFVLGWCANYVLSNRSATSAEAQRLIDYLNDRLKRTKSRETLP